MQELLGLNVRRGLSVQNVNNRCRAIDWLPQIYSEVAPIAAETTSGSSLVLWLALLR